MDELLEKGFFTPSMSHWGALVLLVKKEDGTLRLYIDYKKLNALFEGACDHLWLSCYVISAMIER